MADLKTHYLGLELKNPVIVGASGLAGTLEGVKKCEKAGAGAVVLKSIFEEQIIAETEKDTAGANYEKHPEAWRYVQNMAREHNISRYLDFIKEASEALSIPVIASVNCTSVGGWTEFASDIEKAGADALELNIYLFELDVNETAQEIEDRYIEIVRSVSEKVTIPIAVKIGSAFTNPAGMITRLSEEDIQAVVLFNRFKEADINIDKMELVHARPFSDPNEIALPLRWIGLLSDDINCEVCGTTGVHSGKDVIKMIMAGAKTVQVCSALYLKGMEHLSVILDEMNDWMDTNKVEKLKDIRGKMSGNDPKTIEMYSRYQFMRYMMEAK